MENAAAAASKLVGEGADALKYLSEAGVRAAMDSFMVQSDDQQMVAGVTKVKTLASGKKESVRPVNCSQVMLQIMPAAGDAAPVPAPMRTMRLGSGAVPAALETALQSMQVDEVAVFRFTHAAFATTSAAAAAATTTGEDGSGEGPATPQVALWQPAPAGGSGDEGGDGAAAAAAAAAAVLPATAPGGAETTATAWPWPEVGAAQAAAAAEEDDAAVLTIKLVQSKNPDDLNGDGVLLKYEEVSGDGEPVESGTMRARIHCSVPATGTTVVDCWTAPISVDVGAAAVASTGVILDVKERLSVGVDIFEESVRMVLGTMRSGERCSCSIGAPYAFGGEGCKELGIPADAVIHADFELVAVEKPGSHAESNPENRLLIAEDAKTKANKMLIAGEIPGALRLYSNALNVLEQDYNWIPELKHQSRMLKMAATLNISLCQYKLGQYGDTIGILTEIVKQDDECVKAYYRMGQAWFQLQEYRNSRLNYEKALSLDDSLSGAKKAIAECKKLEREQELADREKYKGMFGKK